MSQAYGCFLSKDEQAGARPTEDVMHLIELARAIQADRERQFRRSWRAGWWAALRHPRAGADRQADGAPTVTTRGTRPAPLPDGRRVPAASGSAATGSAP